MAPGDSHTGSSSARSPRHAAARAAALAALCSLAFVGAGALLLGSGAPAWATVAGLWLAGAVVTWALLDRALRHPGPSASAGDHHDLAALDAFPDMVLAIDEAARLRYVNPALVRRLGPRPGELLGRDCGEGLTPARASRLIASQQRVLASGAPDTFEEIVAVPDGAITLSTTLVPWRRDGQLVGAIAVSRDVTARPQGDGLLVDTSLQLRLLLEGSRAGTWELDLDTMESRWSRSTWELYGLSPQEVRPSREAWIGVVVPEDRERVSMAISSALKLTGELDVTYRALVPGGMRWLVTRGRLMSSTEGQPQRLAGVVMDVTDELSAAEAVAESQRQLQLALDAAKAGTWQQEVATGQSRWSDQTWRLFGLSPSTAEPSAETWLSTIHPEDRGRVTERTRAAMSSGAELDLEYRVALPGDAARIVHLLGRPVLGAGGQPTRYAGIAMDVTERRTAGEAVHASREMSRVLAMLSHELRTPLNGVLGFASLLEERLAGHPALEYAARIRESGEALTRIVNDVLDAARLEAGQLHLEARPFALAGLVASVAQHHRPAAEAKGLSLQVELDVPRDLQALGDAARLRQVVHNLLDNAVRFTERGEVALRAAASRAADGRWALRLAVSDTGVGLDAARLARLLDPAGPADGEAGLGLSICRRIVEAMGGRLEATSTPGAGSSFTVELQLVEVVQAPAEAPAPAAAAAAAPRRVLIVDDAQINRLVIRRLLEKDGHSVEEADDGTGAVAKATIGRYDLILMDIEMPTMSGLEATRAIRRTDGPNRAATIVALTGRAADRDVADALQSGMDGHLAKPVTPAQLKALLAGLSQPG